MLDQPEIRERIHPISVATYHALGEMGLVDEKVELLRGYLVDKMSKSPLHSSLVRRLFRLLQEHVRAAGFELFKEDPLTFSDSEPEPDLAVVKPSTDDHLSGHPTHAELVVEVSISTVAVDREKTAIYAEAGIPRFWLVCPNTREIEVFSKPEGDRYLSREIVRADDRLSSDLFPDLNLQVGELFEERS